MEDVQEDASSKDVRMEEEEDKEEKEKLAEETVIWSSGFTGVPLPPFPIAKLDTRHINRGPRKDACEATVPYIVKWRRIKPMRFS